MGSYTRTKFPRGLLSSTVWRYLYFLETGSWCGASLGMPFGLWPNVIREFRNHVKQAELSFEINIPCLHLVYFPPHGPTSEARIDSDPNGAISDRRTPSCRLSWL
jgi:hypothetical protein